MTLKGFGTRPPMWLFQRNNMNKNNVHLVLSQQPKSLFVKDGITVYIQKLKPYADICLIEQKKSKSFDEQLKKLEKSSITILLDEKGRQFNSISFAKTWEALVNQKAKGISFMVGGAFGFPVPPRADISLSLSSFTLNHELVPLVLLEQVYRAYTILKGHPYHHA